MSCAGVGGGSGRYSSVDLSLVRLQAQGREAQQAVGRDVNYSRVSKYEGIKRVRRGMRAKTHILEQSSQQTEGRRKGGSARANVVDLVRVGGRGNAISDKTPKSKGLGGSCRQHLTWGSACANPSQASPCERSLAPGMTRSKLSHSSTPAAELLPQGTSR